MRHHYLIPKDVKSDYHWWGKIYFKDVAFVGGCYLMGQQLAPLIHQGYQGGFKWFCVGVGIILSFSLTHQMNTQLWEAWLYWVISPKQSYGRVIEVEVKEEQGDGVSVEED